MRIRIRLRSVACAVLVLAVASFAGCAQAYTPPEKAAKLIEMGISPVAIDLMVEIR